MKHLLIIIALILSLDLSAQTYPMPVESDTMRVRFSSTPKYVRLTLSEEILEGCLEGSYLKCHLTRTERVAYFIVVPTHDKATLMHIQKYFSDAYLIDENGWRSHNQLNER